MKKRWIAIVAGLLVLLFIVGAVASYMFLGTLVKKGVEHAGPAVTKTKVKLDLAAVSLFSGKGQLKGLVIGNPEGFKSADAIKVGTVDVKVEPRSVFSDKVIIRSVHVKEPEITYEADLKGSNLAKILDNIRSGEAKGSEATNSAAAKKLQVDEFVISGAKIHVSATLLGGAPATLRLPEIRVANLGQGPEGVTPRELSEAVFKMLIDGTAKALAQNALTMGKDIGGAAKALGSGAADQLKKNTGDLKELFNKK